MPACDPRSGPDSCSRKSPLSVLCQPLYPGLGGLQAVWLSCVPILMLEAQNPCPVRTPSRCAVLPALGLGWAGGVPREPLPEEAFHHVYSLSPMVTLGPADSWEH